MPFILSIETAITVCSVAIARDGQLISLKESSDKNTHSSVITLFIDEVIRQSGIEKKQLDAVAVSAGPGSYTGLRIGVATAKGLCYALDKPMIAIGTLDAMAVGMREINKTTRNAKPETRNQLLFCPMLDARRMEVYSAVFDHDLMQIRETRAEIINEKSFFDYLVNQPMIFAGDGADKCRDILRDHKNAIILDKFAPSAKFMTGLAEQKFREGIFENIAYFEPFYLKDFIAGKPRVKGLR